MRRTLRSCLFAAMAIALFGAYALANGEVQVQAAATSLLNATRTVQNSAVEFSYELYRPDEKGDVVINGCRYRCIGTASSSQTPNPIAYAGYAVRLIIGVFVPDPHAVDVSWDQNAYVKENERNGAKVAKATRVPGVGWCIWLPILKPGTLYISATAYGKNVRTEYAAGRRFGEVPAHGYGKITVQSPPPEAETLPDNILIRWALGNTWVPAMGEVSPGAYQEMAARGALSGALQPQPVAQPAQPPVPPVTQPAAEPEPQYVPAEPAAAVVRVALFLQNGSRLDYLPLDLTKRLNSGDILVFRDNGQKFATAKVANAPRNVAAKMRPGDVYAVMLSGIGRDASNADVGVIRNGGRR